jgi:hypothetical protein
MRTGQFRARAYPQFIIQPPPQLFVEVQRRRLLPEG